MGNDDDGDGVMDDYVDDDGDGVTAVPIRPYVDREGSHIHDWVCTLA